ncbi:hypothetical protein Pmar_PMAR027167 [Perkinsus marinus ATCC 50983]|uniref:Uncharacterized protein n=1 Tax=Perkinsus marinus (strain ATCC 50983 / TXsc) TaxID=423536 RepID=C5LR96_PERM5|nr:hypothetical protein Pmar_PMAR027167 [Perkinsus marinus ATCC 50983]EER00748.1 hypothetical protein Pmar_PMAR027167 [Perkinsus marinus ATCC 50983]|eukprot:XP_002768030.1 hypothetical protein Pmar_PMAR027167 [Perkinsus marinus ATCC 50983]
MEFHHPSDMKYTTEKQISRLLQAAADIAFFTEFYATSRTIQSILKVAFGFDDLKSNLSAAGVVLTAYLLTLGTAKLQRKQCEMWDKEQKKK